MFKNSKSGWLQIGSDEYSPDLEGLWIKSSYVEIGTTNYDNQKVPLREKPSKDAKVIGHINGTPYLNVLDCNGEWVYVKKNDEEGWLSPEFICTNPITNCN